MAETMIEVNCDLCGRPVMVRARARKVGRGRFHRTCAQIARTLGRKNPNYIRGERAYHSTRISRARRAKIHERDGHRCVQCRRASKKIDPVNGKRLDVHHVTPVGDGGGDTDDNLVSLCRRCHNRIEHGREKLRWTPSSSVP
jgi:5-methylcytosine-specific restriction endonuclease McrA